MAAADSDAESDAERAETYLRLRAEAELRKALSLPRYRRPRRYGPPSHVHRIAAMQMMRVSRVSAIHTFASAGSSAPPSKTPRLAQRAGAALVTARHRATFAVWQMRARYQREPRPPRAEKCLDRVTRLADVLTNAGAISDETRTDVTAGMAAALAARSLIDQSQLLAYAPDASSTATAASIVPPGGSTGPAAARLQAIPVGQSTEYEVAGQRIRVYLGALIIGATFAKLTVTARLLSGAAGLSSGAGAEQDDDDPVLSLDDCTAVDDRGARYHAGFSGGGSDERWDGMFEFRNPPPPGVRWLDVTVQSAAPVRIDMNAAVPELATASVPLPDGAAGRYLESLILSALVGRRSMEWDSEDDGQLAEAAADLLDAGLIAPDSLALRMAGAAAELLNLRLPPRLAGLGTAELPADWLVMLARWDSHDGPVGVIPLVAQLPDLEGMQCLITGIESERESATIQVCARGWVDHSYGGMTVADWFRWTARDDGGCLYTADESQGGYDEDTTDITLLLRPPIRPQARSLTINLTGRTAQVGVTVPLDWQADE
jgi:hypothetical protein